MNTGKYMLWALLFFPLQMTSGYVWAESTKKDKSSTSFISHARDKELHNSLYKDLLIRDGLHSQLADTSVIVPFKANADYDPKENINVAERPEYADVVEEHSLMLERLRTKVNN